MTARAVNVYSTVCKDVLLDVYTCCLTVTIFSVLPMQSAKFLKSYPLILSPQTQLESTSRSAHSTPNHSHSGADGHIPKTLLTHNFSSSPKDLGANANVLSLMCLAVVSRSWIFQWIQQKLWGSERINFNYTQSLHSRCKENSFALNGTAL